MPVVVMVSSVIFALAQSETARQRAGNPLVSWAPQTAGEQAETPRIAWISADSGRLRLDLAALPAISPANPARDFLALFVFARVFGVAPDRAEIEPITTEEKAGPDSSEAGIEHEGIKRCSQSSKPAAGSTASFRMMCSR
jgi:hypothetical protein